MSTDFAELLKEVRAYLRCQQEIYGDELYVDHIGLKRNSEHVAGHLDLPALEAEVQTCKKCALHRGRRTVVFGSGNPAARIMIIGEGPGVDEDKQGQPFVGAAGQLLTKILKAIQLERDEVYITNIVKCHPPGNRNPEADEQSACRSILEQQISIIKPQYILALGLVAGQALTGEDKPLHQLRGRVFDRYKAKLMVTYHPAALLRRSELKRDVWEDVQKFQRLYQSNEPATI